MSGGNTLELLHRNDATLPPNRAPESIIMYDMVEPIAFLRHRIVFPDTPKKLRFIGRPGYALQGSLVEDKRSMEGPRRGAQPRESNSSRGRTGEEGLDARVDALLEWDLHNIWRLSSTPPSSSRWVRFLEVCFASRSVRRSAPCPHVNLLVTG